MRKLNQALLASALSLSVLSCGNVQEEASYQVIPLPQEVSLSQAAPFKLTKGTPIVYPEDNALLQRNAEFLADYINQATGYKPEVKAVAPDSKNNGAIALALDSSITNKEGYVLKRQLTASASADRQKTVCSTVYRHYAKLFRQKPKELTLCYQP